MSNTESSVAGLEFVSFVVTAVTTNEFPPRTYSAPYWELARTVATEIISNEIAEAYEKLGVGALDIRVIPITA
jgi:hypothetical protein